MIFMYQNFSEDYLTQYIKSIPKNEMNNLLEKRQFSEAFYKRIFYI